MLVTHTRKSRRTSVKGKLHRPQTRAVHSVEFWADRPRISGATPRAPARRTSTGPAPAEAARELTRGPAPRPAPRTSTGPAPAEAPPLPAALPRSPPGLPASAQPPPRPRPDCASLTRAALPADAHLPLAFALPALALARGSKPCGPRLARLKGVPRGAWKEEAAGGPAPLPQPHGEAGAIHLWKLRSHASETRRRAPRLALPHGSAARAEGRDRAGLGRLRRRGVGRGGRGEEELWGGAEQGAGPPSGQTSTGGGELVGSRRGGGAGVRQAWWGPWVRVGT